MILISLAAVITATAAVLYASSSRFSQFGAAPKGELLEKISLSTHHNGREFVNDPPADVQPHGFWNMMRRLVFGKEIRRPRDPLPVETRRKTDFDTPHSGIRVTWLGHSTLIVEIDGIRVLTDPIWSDRCSPFSILGPRRFHPVPLALDELPELDAVIISHDHYDHLDRGFVRDVLNRLNVPVIVPLGLSAHLVAWGMDPGRIRELDWWEAATLAEGRLTITAGPAQHFSGRGPGTRNRTFWATWAIAAGDRRVFFSGDTGPFDRFREIGERLGPFDLDLMKIGAYDRAWPDMHLTPEQAVQAHIDLNAKVLLPIHWGTFTLAFHHWFEPPERFVREAERRGIRTVIPRPGGMVDPADPPEIEHWWREAQTGMSS